jgi:hypothetical protein
LERKVVVQNFVQEKIWLAKNPGKRLWDRELGDKCLYFSKEMFGHKIQIWRQKNQRNKNSCRQKLEHMKVMKRKFSGKIKKNRKNIQLLHKSYHADEGGAGCRSPTELRALTRETNAAAPDTTGIRGFAECPEHSAKGTRQRFRRQRRLCRVSFVGHSAKRSTQQNVNRKKSKKMKQEKKNLLGRHAHPASDPSNELHIFFNKFS